ncbi:MAG: TIM-barrel domain-containing protein [Bacteroidota bacterium]
MYRIIIVLLILSCFGCQSELTYQLTGNKVTFQDGKYQVSITAVTDDVIKVQYEGDSIYSDRVYAPILKSDIPFTITNNDNAVSLATKTTKVEVQLDPFSISFNTADGVKKLSEEKGLVQSADTSALRFHLSENEAIYGTGSRAIPMNRRGEKFLNYNRPQYGYGYGGKEINYNIPHLYSSEEYMLLIDNPAKAWFDIGASESDILEFASLGGNLAYYFVNGDSYEELIDEYTDLTGKQPLPPIWALGNLHSRFGYHSQAETEASVKKALDQDYPIDAVILDIYWFGPELEDGQMGKLDWDLENWPEPKAMIENFKKQDINTITVSEPFFTLKSGEFESLAEQGLLATNDEGETATIPDFYFGEGGLLDIFKAEAQTWIWDRYKYMKTYGVEGWWVDLGEPEKHPSYMRHVNGTADEIHGVYGHTWAQMLYEGYQKDYPNERLLHLGRSGFAGTQRYGLVPWSGDISRSWSGFKAQLPIMLGMGVSGLCYMHSDAGGFSMVDGPDAELYTRWLQFAAFTPIFRPHADQIVPAEPSEWPKEVQKNVKPYVDLRYKLLPYNYTLAWKNMTTGMPMARPMFMEYSNLPDTLEWQYMWGEDFLIAPVLEQGATAMDVYLPEGDWYQYWTTDKVQGGNWHNEALSIKNTPVFVRAGAIIPTKEGISRTTQYSNGQLTLTYYASDNPSETVVYYDDGKTPQAYDKNQYQLIEIAIEPSENDLSISLNTSGEGYSNAPENREIKFELIGLPYEVTSTDESVSIENLEDKQVISFDYQDSKEIVLKRL